jgi:Flp pilus assembly protein TadD
MRRHITPLLLLTALVPRAAQAATKALRYRKPLDTVVVVTEQAPILVSDKVVATAERGQWFGVRERTEDRLAIQKVVNGHLVRTGWLRAADARTLADDEVDLATDALKLSRVVKPDLDASAYRQRVTALAKRAAGSVERASSPRARAAAISRLLFRRERYAYERDSRLLHTVLDTKRGNCLSLSLLYLCIARELGLPLHMVAVPKHAFLRYDDGRTRFNIEPSLGGILFRGTPPALRRARSVGGIHLTVLSAPQAIGFLLSDLGVELGRQGRHADACRRFARAVETAPQIAEAYCGWGVSLARLKKFPPACDKFSRAVQVHPLYANAWMGWGSALAEMGELRWACEKYAKAVEVDPQSSEAWFNWGSALLVQGRRAEGTDKLERAARLDPRLRPAVERLRRAVPAESDAPR